MDHDAEEDEDDDTFVLTDMATTLQQHCPICTFSGSNQHGLLINYLKQDQDFPTLTVKFHCL
jgi:hypothetical protein